MIKRIKYINLLVSSFALLVLFALPTSATEPSHQPEDFFSLKALQEAPKKALMPIETMTATDGVELAFRAYLPQEPSAIVIFYHGAGAHSGLSYQHIGVGLRDRFSIGVYMPDIRGHGFSQGERGDTPSKEQVWSDINTMVNQIKTRYPKVPIFVGGHSAGAGLALNYSSWEHKLAVEGYVFLAPYWGYRSKTSHDHDERYQFSTVKVSRFILHAISGGWLFSHSKAVYFHYPAHVLEQHPEIVTFNTVAMSNAVTPYAPGEQLSGLKRVGLWIGRQDEAFDAKKVIEFSKRHYNVSVQEETVMIEGENHFSILLEASEKIGPWILKSIH
ncbi:MULTISPECIES: alpha/beta fold hydrolase [unclassified Vibrio]|uniref:Alpha/beta fold hydrolase n=1 Tax=Vibrio sp. HB236076 TaxID=3232307 RepID=A0AB39H6I5_9VIBR|nr:alpha/beta hydrolase [Vibrio sp. HB161653]MDP5253461.1 alpha/beta fold hydrolase [Vibrio sp. HB161653]